MENFFVKCKNYVKEKAKAAKEFYSENTDAVNECGVIAGLITIGWICGFHGGSQCTAKKLNKQVVDSLNSAANTDHKIMVKGPNGKSTYTYNVELTGHYGK